MRKFLFFLLFLPLTAFPQEKILPVDITADEISYSHQDTKAIAKKNVKIVYKDITIFCDEAEYDAKNHIGILTGNVKITREKETVYAENIIYDFNKGYAKIINADIESPPLYGKTTTGEKIEEKYVLKDGYITTCNLDKPHYKITAKRLILFPKVKVIAKNVFIKIGDFPIFYFPYMSISLKDKSFPLQIIPGKNSKWGQYVLTRYRYRINDNQKGKVILDYYKDRGIGTGIIHKSETKNFGETLINYYSIKDKFYKIENRDKLFNEYPERESIDEEYLENNRYRGSLSYSFNPYNNLSIKAEFNKFSDEYFVKDFFYREYEKEPHPLSYALIDYSLEGSSLSFLAQKRFNKFFEETEYLPSIEYNLFRRNIGLSNFYFESKTNFGSLNYKYKYSEDDFDSLRIYSKNTLSYIDNLAFLYVNPYISLYNSFYSDGLYENNLYRFSPEVGLNLSTKLYKYFDINPLDLKLRHILTPKISYKYLFPPTVSQNQIFNFDQNDILSRNQSIIFTLDNKLQAKNSKKIWDLIYFSPSLEYSLKKENMDGSRFEKINSILEIYPTDFLSIKHETEYDCLDRAMKIINLDFIINEPKNNKYSISFGHRYLRNESSQSTLGLTYNLTSKLQFRNYLRYEYKDKEFKEQQYTLRTDLHCWWLDLGLNVDRQKDFTFWFAFILKDFPDIHMGFDHTYQSTRSSY